MDMSCFHLMQILLLLLLFYGVYRISVSLPMRKFVPVCIVYQQVLHPVYRHFCQQIQKENLYAFDKYQIWRYIEKRKGISGQREFIPAKQ